MSALKIQVGGDHYKDFPIQPIEFCYKNGLDFLSGNVIKYVCRYKAKKSVDDLRKAIHYIECLIDLSEQNNKTEENNIYKLRESGVEVSCVKCHADHLIHGRVTLYGNEYGLKYEECNCKCHSKLKDEPL